MTPLALLLAACFSDVTHHQGCGSLQTADLKYYHADHFSEDGKKYVENQYGKELVTTVGMVGYTIYKKQLVYHVSSYGIKLTSNEFSGSIKFGF